MEERTCKNCKYFKKPAKGYGCGQCTYPMPNLSGLSFYLNGYEARECLTYDEGKEDE